MFAALAHRHAVRGGSAGRLATGDLRAAAVLLLGLAAVIAVRFVAVRDDFGDPIVAGVAFGVALLVLAAVGRPRTAATSRSGAFGLAVPTLGSLGRSTAIGLAGGAALIALALVGRALAAAPGLPPVFRSDLFPAWALATVVVAAGEEAVLRGALLDRLMRSRGLTTAVLATSLVFALMHVPFYGWRVVPLDLGVGLWLAGLRLASRGLVAPTLAHALADLATWWL